MYIKCSILPTLCYSWSIFLQNYSIKGFIFFCFYKLCLSSVQSLSRVQLLVTPWAAAHQASLSIINSQSLLRLMSIESVMPSNHLILCRPLLLPPSIFPSIRVFSSESVLHTRWPKHWSFSFRISPRLGPLKTEISYFLFHNQDQNLLNWKMELSSFWNSFRKCFQ